MAMPLIHLLALTATVFNREQDTGTFAWLRSLPLKLPEVWISKVAVPFVLSIVLLVILLLFGRYLHGDWETEYELFKGKVSQDGHASAIDLLSVHSLGLDSGRRQSREQHHFPWGSSPADGGLCIRADFVSVGECFGGRCSGGPIPQCVVGDSAPRLAGFRYRERQRRPGTALVPGSASSPNIASGLQLHWHHATIRDGHRVCPGIITAFAMGATRLDIPLVVGRHDRLHRRRSCTVAADLEGAHRSFIPFMFSVAVIYLQNVQEKRTSQSGQLLIQHGVNPARVFWLRLASATVMGVAMTAILVTCFITRSNYGHSSDRWIGFLSIHTMPLVSGVIAAGMLMSLSFSSPLLAIAATFGCAVFLGGAVVYGLEPSPAVLANHVTVDPTADRHAPANHAQPAEKKRLAKLGPNNCCAGNGRSSVLVHSVRLSNSHTRKLGTLNQRSAPFWEYDENSANLILSAIEASSPSPRIEGESPLDEAGQLVSWFDYCRDRREYRLTTEGEAWWAENKDLLAAQLDHAIATAQGLHPLTDVGYHSNDFVAGRILWLIDLYLMRGKTEMAAGKTQSAADLPVGFATGRQDRSIRAGCGPHSGRQA